jgi:hypothetical protein
MGSFRNQQRSTAIGIEGIESVGDGGISTVMSEIVNCDGKIGIVCRYSPKLPLNPSFLSLCYVFLK